MGTMKSGTRSWNDFPGRELYEISICHPNSISAVDDGKKKKDFFSL